MRILSIVLGLALVIAVVYSVTVTGDRNALKAELESVHTTLASTQSDLASTKQTLGSTQAELDSTEETLESVENELQAIQEKLELYEETSGTKIYSDVQPMVNKPGYQGQVNLINNPNAANRTWQDVWRFLLDDPTDDEVYEPESFVCTNFAEIVHNNAEADGIRAAFVTIHFEGGGPGHALNAFLTTDKGVVYVDCTGQGFLEDITELDKFAYVLRGEELGLISIDYYLSADYQTYLNAVLDRNRYELELKKYNRAVEAYNDEVKEFNREVRDFEEELEEYEREMEGQMFPDFGWWWELSEWQREIEAWESRLIDMEGELEARQRALHHWSEELKTVWEPRGIVSSIEIYW